MLQIKAESRAVVTDMSKMSGMLDREAKEEDFQTREKRETIQALLQVNELWIARMEQLTEQVNENEEQ